MTAIRPVIFQYQFPDKSNPTPGKEAQAWDDVQGMLRLSRAIQLPAEPGIIRYALPPAYKLTVELPDSPSNIRGPEDLARDLFRSAEAAGLLAVFVGAEPSQDDAFLFPRTPEPWARKVLSARVRDTRRVRAVWMVQVDEVYRPVVNAAGSLLADGKAPPSGEATYVTAPDDRVHSVHKAAVPVAYRASEVAAYLYAIGDPIVGRSDILDRGALPQNGYRHGDRSEHFQPGTTGAIDLDFSTHAGVAQGFAYFMKTRNRETVEHWLGLEGRQLEVVISGLISQRYDHNGDALLEGITIIAADTSIADGGPPTAENWSRLVGVRGWLGVEPARAIERHGGYRSASISD